ncbi:hypothetical protein GCM10008915_78090 [Bifidobacterium pullorum subsp. gallinarum]
MKMKEFKQGDFLYSSSRLYRSVPEKKQKRGLNILLYFISAAYLLTTIGAVMYYCYIFLKFAL